ncbi:MAG: CapA family protein [Anaerolineaceae bacterium]|nr:CapA family protein [Anaerolineaceae bacterium]
MKRQKISYFVIMFCLVVNLSGCGYFNISVPDQSTEPFSVEQEVNAPLPIDITLEIPVEYQIDFTDPVPERLLSELTILESNGKLQATGEISLLYSTEEDGIANWIYVAATAFSNLVDVIEVDELLALWKGNPINEKWTRIYIQESDLAVLKMKFGLPDASFVKTITPELALSTAWQEPDALFILAFEQLEPRWKVLKFNNDSIFSRPFVASEYPLNFSYVFNSDMIEINKAIETPITNYDQRKMSSVLMTGVTALVRATGAKMESEGFVYPASTIQEVLLDADITHISNEVSFAEDCPPSNAYQENIMFCSRPEYFELLTYADIDLVELSGNHLKDWSNAAFDFSLQLYDDAGVATYSGGINQLDAREPYKIELNGNKLAFLGCNPAGPPNVWATDTLSGVANCEDDWLLYEVQALAADGYLPIVTMQHYETYAMLPNLEQKTDFLKLSANGAVIVSGSQAHFPQAMTFIGDHFIHYGLGNLFFDQMDIPVVGTRREFLDRHVFYDGQYIQTELYTAMLEDFSRPRIMTEEERLDFLEDIFTASNWIKSEDK